MCYSRGIGQEQIQWCKTWVKSSLKWDDSIQLFCPWVFIFFKHNSITVEAMGAVLYVPFIFADREKCWFGSSMWWLPLCNGNRLYFHSGYVPWLQRYFSNSSWFELLCNKLNITDREPKWMLQFQTITGARHYLHFS